VTPLPAIRGLRRNGRDLTIELDLTPHLIQFDGHFPGMPILPAVVQIDWAMTLARDHFELPAHFTALRGLKFTALVQPPVTLTLALAHADDGRSVGFTYTQGDTTCATGRIEFADDAARPDRSLL
jgi:3-hydroxymyristoyl/3-hydroxydecanoyl-(acyl carrier protein) dehydratase